MFVQILILLGTTYIVYVRYRKTSETKSTQTVEMCLNIDPSIDDTMSLDDESDLLTFEINDMFFKRK